MKEVAYNVNVNLILKIKTSVFFFFNSSSRRLFGLFSFPSLFLWAVDRFTLAGLLSQDESWDGINLT